MKGKITIEYIATTGICDYLCFDCEIEKACKKHNKLIDCSMPIDQKEFRKETASQYLGK